MKFLDPSSYGSGKKGIVITEEGIIMEQVQKCVTRGSVELRGSYWEEKSSAEGIIEKKYTPSTIESFCNSVVMLKILLITRMYKETKDKLKPLEKTYGEEEKDSSAIIRHLKIFEILLELLKKKNFFQEKEGEEIIE